MFATLQNNKEFERIISQFLSKHSLDILDIFLFGSTVRGKTEPNDIDFLLVFKNKEDSDLEYDLRKKLQKIFPQVTITTKTYASLFSEVFLAKQGILSEGFSLLHKKMLSECFGYTSFILFHYSLQNFTQSQRMQFQYSLYGRKKEGGMIKELSLIKFADGILLSPILNADATKKYLKYWNIQFEEFPSLFPLQLKK